jgi:hypothetical protein
MKGKSCLILTLVTLLGTLIAGSAAFADNDPGQLVPKRLSSIGDSITVAINAEMPLENNWASWVNGYHGFWQWLFGLTDVNSHNQRITETFGWSGRRNYMEAASGADSFDFGEQAI